MTMNTTSNESAQLTFDHREHTIGKHYFAVFSDGRYATMRMYKQLRRFDRLRDLQLAEIVYCYPHEASNYARSLVGTD